MEDNLIQLFHELNKILTNVKKTPNRPYTKVTCEKKLVELSRLRDEFNEAIENIEETKEIIALKTDFGTIFKLANKTILETLKNTNLEINLETTKNMTSSDFKIETAMKAIPSFSGNYKELDSFLTITEIINNSLNDEGKKELLNFVFHVKLSDNVKTALGLNYSKPLEELSKDLRNRYKNNITLSQLLSRISSIAQRNQSINAYKERILTNISELNRIQISQLGNNVSTEQKQVITTTNDIQALYIFKNGLNDNIKQTVIAAQPKNFADAVDIALEVENSNNNQGIMHIQKNFTYRNRNLNDNYNRNNYNNKNNYHSRNNYNNNNNRNNYNNYNNNNNNNRNNYNNNNSRNFNRNENYTGNNNFNNKNNSNNNYNNNRYNNNNQNYQNNNRNDNNYRSNNNQARVHVTNLQDSNQDFQHVSQGNHLGSEHTVTPDSQM